MPYFNINKTRRGFTLIELLVVIVIIGILGSLVFVGGRAARDGVNRGVISTEISGFSMALDNYRKEFGEYPPDFSDEAAVLRHVRKRWPHFDWQRTYPDEKARFQGFCDMIKAQTGYDFSKPDNPADPHDDKSRGAHIGAFAFWVGGIPNESIGMLNGFSADVANPLGVKLNGNKFDRINISQWDSKSQFMDLTLGSNCDIVDGLPVIISKKYPIAYFKPNAAGKYLQRNTTEPLCFHFHFSDPKWEDLSIGVPYAKSGTDADEAVWYNPKSFQLIHPGLDGKFSVNENDSLFEEFRVIDSSKDIRTGCTLADNDNQANFGGTTIESSGN